MDQLEKLFSKLPRYHDNPGFFRVTRFIEKNSLFPDAFTVIIGGTNGKGSVGVMLEKILLKAGFRVGSFRSPHVYDFCERIAFDGVPVSREIFIEAARSVNAFFSADRCLPTFYDCLTASALLCFTRYFKPQFILLEVGMGGLLDPVNAVRRDISIITNIGHDHSHVLGSYPMEIAERKAGIISPGVPFFSAERNPAVIDYFKEVCRKAGSPSTFCGTPEVARIDFSGTAVDYDGETIICGIPGSCQGENTGLVIDVARHLQKNFNISDSSINEGIASARLPWRMELASDDPPVIFDGAHNRESWSNLRDTLSYFSYDRLNLIVSMQKLKSPADFPDDFGPGPISVYLPHMGDASFHRPDEIARHLKLKNAEIHVEDNLNTAAKKALAEAGIGGLAVFTGSFKSAVHVRSLVEGMLNKRTKVPGGG